MKIIWFSFKKCGKKIGLSKKQIKNLPKNIVGIRRTNSTKELTEIYTASDVFFKPTLELRKKEKENTLDIVSQEQTIIMIKTRNFGNILNCMKLQ